MKIYCKVLDKPIRAKFSEKGVRTWPVDDVMPKPLRWATYSVRELADKMDVGDDVEVVLECQQLFHTGTWYIQYTVKWGAKYDSFYSHTTNRDALGVDKLEELLKQMREKPDLNITLTVDNKPNGCTFGEFVGMGKDQQDYIVQFMASEMAHNNEREALLDRIASDIAKLIDKPVKLDKLKSRVLEMIEFYGGGRMTREQATIIRDHAIMKWEAIVNGEPMPEVCKQYIGDCSFCDAFYDKTPGRLGGCCRCPLDCLYPGSNWWRWHNLGHRKETAQAMLDQIKAVTVEQLMEAANDKRTSNNNSRSCYHEVGSHSGG